MRSCGKRVATSEFKQCKTGSILKPSPGTILSKIGTLNNILKNIAEHLDLTKEELANKLFN